MHTLKDKMASAGAPGLYKHAFLVILACLCSVHAASAAAMTYGEVYAGECGFKRGFTGTIRGPVPIDFNILGINDINYHNLDAGMYSLRSVLYGRVTGRRTRNVTVEANVGCCANGTGCNNLNFGAASSPPQGGGTTTNTTTSKPMLFTVYTYTFDVSCVMKNELNTGNPKIPAEILIGSTCPLDIYLTEQTKLIVLGALEYEENSTPGNGTARFGYRFKLRAVYDGNTDNLRIAANTCGHRAELPEGKDAKDIDRYCPSLKLVVADRGCSGQSALTALSLYSYGALLLIGLFLVQSRH